MAGKYVPLKFETSTEIKPIVYEVTLSFDKPLISPSKFDSNKSNIWYGIEEKITGENGFNASENLHAMIELLKFKKGSTFEIKKHQGDKYTFFSINGKTLNELSPIRNTTENAETIVVKPKEGYSDEKKLNVLWEDYQKRIKKDNLPLQKEDNLPF